MKTSASIVCFCVMLSSLASLTAGLAVMSIDFGNEYMKIAIVKPGVPMEIVLNKESTRKTPTTIALKDGERLVGEPAVNTAIRFPKHGYRYLLDIIGKHFDNPQVQLYKKRFPYHEIEKDPETGTVLMKHADGTMYSPEELVGMILQKAKEYAETFAEQPINEAVITVPPFFNQAERRAMLRAAELAGLRVLQLINDNTAVALNYGVFRRKVFNATALNYMFFDIGASGTTATVVSYQVVKVKSPVSGVVDSYPQLAVKGVGFDRSLGGTEFQLRLRDFLADEFNKVKKTKKDVKTDARAMQKLYKEAGRVKQVLSANADHFAQVESLLDDEDFRTKVTREQFETLCQDLVDRVGKVISDAISRSELTMANIEEVILMGGGTRIPKVQQAIMTAIGRQELGKGINTDEAAALGAVYQAAHLGKGFKVKNFGIKDATMYPIVVEFERVRPKEDEASTTLSKTVKRVLFGHMQPYPQKKVMTFNKHVKDFSFEVNYGDLSFLSDKELKEFGSTHIETVSLTGVEDAHAKHGQDGEPKGIKAHFRVDDSALLYLDKVEAQFEKATKVVDEESQSTLSKIGSTISNLFSSSSVKSKDDEKEEATKKVDGTPSSGSSSSQATVENEPDEDVKKAEQTSEQPESTKDEKLALNETTAANDTETGKDDEKTKTKMTTVRVDIKVETALKDLQDPSEEKTKKSKKLIAELKKLEEEKHQLAKVKNEIEAFIFDAQDKLEQRDYKLCSSEEERVAISAKLSQASDWLVEQGDDTPRKDYEEKLKQLKTATNDVFDRVKEYHERPSAIAALNAIVNHTEFFRVAMQNYTGEDLPFTQVEYDVLDKMINDTKDWNKTVHAQQAKTPLTEKPKFTIEDVAVKIAALDREVKYLINKMKSYRPKAKPTKEAANTTDSGNETKSTEDSKKKLPGDETTKKAEDPNLDILEGTDQEDSSSEKVQKDDKSSNHEPGDEL